MCNLVWLPRLPEHKYTNFITTPPSDTNTTHASVWSTDYLRYMHNQNNCTISTNAQISLEVSRVSQGTNTNY